VLKEERNLEETNKGKIEEVTIRTLFKNAPPITIGALEDYHTVKS
jgi:hypothetical protein